MRLSEKRKQTEIPVSKHLEANAFAIEGENTAKISIANSDANRREKEAEALRAAITAEKVQQAKALELGLPGRAKSGDSPK